MLAELGRPSSHKPAGAMNPSAASSTSKTDDEPALLVGDLVDRAAHAGFGFLVGILALISGPFVGMSTPFGLAIAFGAVQMMIGLERPWLPRFIRRIRVSPRVLRWLSERLARWMKKLERLVRPRFELLTRGPFWSLCGFCILIEALLLSLPLPIPGSNFPFILTIVLYSIGLLEKDGLLVMLSHAFVAVQVALALAFWGAVRAALQSGLHWFGAT